MTPESQRIAIAEACGWKWESPFSPRKKFNDLIHPSGTKRGGMARVWKDGALGGTGLPDYPADLNAMHEAEKSLTDAQMMEYADYLYWSKDGKGLIRRALRATAAQRAEAFLRTIGRWDDSQ